MAERIFQELVQDNTSHQKHVCVGLDTDIDRIRPLLGKGLLLQGNPTSDVDIVIAYNRMVIDATADIAGAYKMNRAFYAKLGRDGMNALMEASDNAREVVPSAMVILDAKYGDIDNTNEGYIAEAYDIVGADAVTLHNYMGHVAMAPFLDLKDKGNFVVVRTSNNGSGEFQDIGISINDIYPLYERVAKAIKDKWNYNGNVGVVAGATYPDESKKVRTVVGDEISLLIPGVGAQGGNATEITTRALKRRQPGVINSSRGIIFATVQEGEHQADAIRREAQKLHDEILTAQNAA